MNSRRPRKEVEGSEPFKRDLARHFILEADAAAGISPVHGAPADRAVRLERGPEARGDAHGSPDGDHGGDHQEEKDLVSDSSGHGPPLFSGDCLTP